MSTPELPLPFEQQPLWDLTGAREVLKAEAVPHPHAIYGAGYRLRLLGARSPTPQLDLFPERLVARYRTDLVRLELRSIRRGQPCQDYLQLSSAEEDTGADWLIYPDGGLTFAVLRPQRSVSSLSPDVADGLADHPASASQSPEATTERAPRVVLTGRVGREAQLRTTAKGRVIARVPLAVQLGEGTAWHTILFFDDFAKRAEALTKGQLITVVGYRHTREATTRTGTTRQVEEIYGVSVQGTK
jgi:hypothetical protein